MLGNPTSSDGDPSVGDIVIPPYSSHDVSGHLASRQARAVHCTDLLLVHVIVLLQIFSNNVAIVAATLYCWEYLR